MGVILEIIKIIIIVFVGLLILMAFIGGIWHSKKEKLLSTTSEITFIHRNFLSLLNFQTVRKKNLTSEKTSHPFTTSINTLILLFTACMNRCTKATPES